MIDPAVTVVVACFNAEGHLAAAVNSTRLQSISSVEIVIVDDCSSDGSLALAQELSSRDSRIRAIRTDRNGGPAKARNAGFAAARGRWVAVLDSDDLMHPDRLRRLVTRAEEDGADIVADDLLLFGQQEEAIGRFLRPKGPIPYWLSLPQYLRETRMHCGKPDLGFLKPMFRREFLERHALSYDEKLRVGEDDDLVVRALLSGARYRIVPSPTYFYRRHSGSISHSHHDRLPVMIERSRQLQAGLAPHDAQVSRLLERRSRARERAYHFGQAVQQLKAGALGKAATTFLKHPAALTLLRLPLQARAARGARLVKSRLFPPRRPRRHPIGRSGSTPVIWYCDRPGASQLVGLEWFCERVLPNLRRRVPGVRLAVPEAAARALPGSMRDGLLVHSWQPADFLELRDEIAVVPALIHTSDPPFLAAALALHNHVIGTKTAFDRLPSCPKRLFSVDGDAAFASAIVEALDGVRDEPRSASGGTGGETSDELDAPAMVELIERAGLRR